MDLSVINTLNEELGLNSSSAILAAKGIAMEIAEMHESVINFINL